MSLVSETPASRVLLRGGDSSHHEVHIGSACQVYLTGVTDRPAGAYEMWRRIDKYRASCVPEGRCC